MGLMPPGVIAHPAYTPAWEHNVGPEQFVEAAKLADELGYSHIGVSEHVAVPKAAAAERGGTYWDPLATLSFLAAHTSRIRLLTQVLVLGYHHPLAVVKRYGTLDRLSGGRVVLGVGVGSLPEEFELLGASYSDRGERADEALRAIKASWGQREPRFHGQHYDFSDFVIDPTSHRSSVPIWVGGSTRRSLRRAVELGDGWQPFGMTFGGYRSALAAFDIPPGFEVVLPAGIPIDPIGAPEAARDTLGRVHDAGATIVNIGVVASSMDQWLDQIRAAAELDPPSAASVAP